MLVLIKCWSEKQFWSKKSKVLPKLNTSKLSLVFFIFHLFHIFLLQRFNLIMTSLACTDLLVGFITPFNTIRIGRWNLGYPFCQFVTSMVVILLSASIYNFVFVNLDRLFAIKMPLLYKETKEKRWMVKLGILACWFLSLFPAIPMWIRSMDTRTKENDGSCFKCSFPYMSVRNIYMYPSNFKYTQKFKVEFFLCPPDPKHFIH